MVGGLGWAGRVLEVKWAWEVEWSGGGSDNVVKPLGEYLLGVLGLKMGSWKGQGCGGWVCGVHVLE